jgi:hypothetical protein
MGTHMTRRSLIPGAAAAFGTAAIGTPLARADAPQHGPARTMGVSQITNFPGALWAKRHDGGFKNRRSTPRGIGRADHQGDHCTYVSTCKASAKKCSSSP